MSKPRKSMADCDPDEVYKWWSSLTDEQRKLKESCRLIEGIFGVTPSIASLQQYIARHKFRERLKRREKTQEVNQKTKGQKQAKTVVVDASISIDDIGSTAELLENVNYQLNTLIDVVVKGVVRIADKKDFKASEASSLLQTAGDVMHQAAEMRLLLIPVSRKDDASLLGGGNGGEMDSDTAEIISFFDNPAARK